MIYYPILKTLISSSRKRLYYSVAEADDGQKVKVKRSHCQFFIVIVKVFNDDDDDDASYNDDFCCC